MDDRQLIADLLSALEYHTEQTRPIEFSKVAIEAAREYLRKPPQRKPLTDDELSDIWFKKSTDWMEFARAIEAAHGIGDNT